MSAQSSFELEIVTATRLDHEQFMAQSALGQSYRVWGNDNRILIRPAFLNSAPLPQIYNGAIHAANASPDAILLFVHDDVWIQDYFILDRLRDALTQFDVVGLAGNKRRMPMQRAWHADPRGMWDSFDNFSGVVGHGEEPLGAISRFGPVPAECELLDGLFLAAKRGTLLQHGVQFDPQFAFHLYDLDFCRSARAAGLRLGTWPISVTHQSGGNFGSPPWRAASDAYLAKWGE